jgi:hypothetical protein
LRRSMRIAWLTAAMETSFACRGACQRIGEWRILAVEAGVNL